MKMFNKADEGGIIFYSDKQKSAFEDFGNLSNENHHAASNAVD